MKELPFTRPTSSVPAGSGGGARSSVVEAAAAMVSRMPSDLLVGKRVLHSEPVARRKMRFEEVKNKPLPKIAML
jgi:formiminotetrahydrofolate cyclodeaminase